MSKSRGGEQPNKDEPADVVEEAVPPPPAPHKEPRDLKAKARSLRHMLTHAEYNEHCEACRLAKLVWKPARRKHRNSHDRPKAFGDLVNADHIVAQSNEAVGLTGKKMR